MFPGALLLLFLLPRAHSGGTVQIRVDTLYNPNSILRDGKLIDLISFRETCRFAMNLTLQVQTAPV